MNNYFGPAPLPQIGSLVFPMDINAQLRNLQDMYKVQSERQAYFDKGADKLLNIRTFNETGRKFIEEQRDKLFSQIDDDGSNFLDAKKFSTLRRTMREIGTDQNYLRLKQDSENITEYRDFMTKNIGKFRKSNTYKQDAILENYVNYSGDIENMPELGSLNPTPYVDYHGDLVKMMNNVKPIKSSFMLPFDAGGGKIYWKETEVYTYNPNTATKLQKPKLTPEEAAKAFEEDSAYLTNNLVLGLTGDQINQMRAEHEQLALEGEPVGSFQNWIRNKVEPIVKIKSQAGYGSTKYSADPYAQSKYNKDLELRNKKVPSGSSSSSSSKKDENELLATSVFSVRSGLSTNIPIRSFNEFLDQFKALDKEINKQEQILSNSKEGTLSYEAAERALTELTKEKNDIILQRKAYTDKITQGIKFSEIYEKNPTFKKNYKTLDDFILAITGGSKRQFIEDNDLNIKPIPAYGGSYSSYTPAGRQDIEKIYATMDKNIAEQNIKSFYANSGILLIPNKRMEGESSDSKAYLNLETLNKDLNVSYAGFTVLEGNGQDLSTYIQNMLDDQWSRGDELFLKAYPSTAVDDRGKIIYQLAIKNNTNNGFVTKFITHSDPRVAYQTAQELVRYQLNSSDPEEVIRGKEMDAKIRFNADVHKALPHLQPVNEEFIISVKDPKTGHPVNFVVKRDSGSLGKTDNISDINYTVLGSFTKYKEGTQERADFDPLDAAVQSTEGLSMEFYKILMR